MLAYHSRSYLTFILSFACVVDLTSAGGLFDYPREEHRLSVNFNDEVIIQWVSDFANQLNIYCSEGIQGGLTWRYNYNIAFNGTRSFSPVQISREFNDWSLPAACALELKDTTAGGYISGATVGVSSVATQPASIFALSQTVALDPTSTITSSVITTSTAVTSSSSLVTSTSAAIPMPTASAPVTSPSSGPGDIGLSTGAKAGIGVGTAAGALLILAAAFAIYRNRRKANNVANRYSSNPYANENKPPGVAVAHTREMQYQHSPPPQELAAAR